MHALRDVNSDELLWIKSTQSRRSFELHAGEAVVATLAWANGSAAVGQWAGGQYHFSRQGWWRQRVIVRGIPTDAIGATVASGHPVATFVYCGGTLRFANGHRFRWRKPKRWTNERVWEDNTATVLVRFRPAGRQPTVVVTGLLGATLPRELSLLFLVGQYLLVLAAQDEETASTAAVVATFGG